MAGEKTGMVLTDDLSFRICGFDEDEESDDDATLVRASRGDGLGERPVATFGLGAYAF